MRILELIGQILPTIHLPRAARCATVVIAVVAVGGIISRSVFAQTSESKQQAAGVAITEKEAQKFAKTFEHALKAEDLTQTNRLISWDDLIKRATEIPNLPELKTARADFKEGAMSGLQKTGSMYGAIIRELKNGASFRFVRSDLMAKEPFVLFRLNLPNNGGLNYHKLYLARQTDGRVLVSDIYVLVSAERMTETLHRAWLQLASQTISKSDKKDAGEWAAFAANAQKKLAMLKLCNDGKFAEFVKEYHNSPETLRREKGMLLAYLTATQSISDDEYKLAIEAFRKFHPQDPALDFLVIDSHLSRENYEEALACVDRTIENIGADSALLTLRANILVFQKNFPDALRTVKKAIAAEPDLADPYSAALGVAIAAHDHDETASLLTILADKFGYDLKDLHEVPVFAEFVKSPQFEKWTESRKKKQK